MDFGRGMTTLIVVVAVLCALALLGAVGFGLYFLVHLFVNLAHTEG